jgi:protein gp37
MAQSSTIEWTQATWNPVTGCTKISAGCKHCYAERMSLRLQAMGVSQYANGFELTPQPGALSIPSKWKKSRLIFVNSMSDLFHEELPLTYIARVFDVMNACTQHTFQILTKRPEIAAAYAPHLKWSSNIWLGTSVENVLVSHRIESLRKVPVTIRFLSLEPLLGPLTRVDLRGIHWVIVGGESGPGARPMEKKWVEQIRDRCVCEGVPFFFKQWGGVQKKRNGRFLNGRTWDEMPRTAQGRNQSHVPPAAARG